MKVELELITEFDKLLVVEIDIRSGMYYTFDQYEKVNNKYMNDYYKKNNHHIISIGTQIICMDGQCRKS